MARKPLRPLIRGGGFYPSRKWTPLVYAGGYTTANGGGEPEPPPIEKTITGNPIHITDALAKPVQALSVKLEPIQDLNGYDNPWPAGGGANKFYYGSNISPTTINGVIISYDKDTESFSISGENNKTDGAYIHTSLAPNSFEFPALSVGQTVYVYFNLPLNTYINITYKDGNNTNKGFPIVGGAGGSGDWKSASFVVPSDFASLNNFQIGIYKEARQFSATGVKIAVGASQFTAWTPYSNICPISGHTDADVTRTGVNVWDEEWENGTFNTTTGANINNGSTNRQIRSKNLIPIVGGQSYYFKWVNSSVSSGLWTMFYDDNGDIITGFVPSGGYVDKSGNCCLFRNRVVETPSNAAYCKFYCTDDYGSTYNHDLSINYPSTDTDYQPYVGTTYPIPLGTTVYGGTLDVLTGVLTVDRASVLLNAFSFDGTSSPERHVFRAPYQSIIPNVKLPESDSDSWDALCSSYSYMPYSPISASDDGKYAIATNIDRLVFIDNRCSTVEEFVQLNASVQIVYPLATPQTIQLTAQQVELLQGENNIWSDGTMTLVYLADGNVSDVEALNILLGGRYVNNHTEDEPSDREALDILLGR